MNPLDLLLISVVKKCVILYFRIIAALRYSQIRLHIVQARKLFTINSASWSTVNTFEHKFRDQLNSERWL